MCLAKPYWGYSWSHSSKSLSRLTLAKMLAAAMLAHWASPLTTVSPGISRGGMRLPSTKAQPG